MPVTFNQNTYEIYMPKEQEYDTPFQPTNPKESMAINPQNATNVIRKGVLIGVGLTVAKRTLDTVRNEIGATTGNEMLQTTINNITTGLGYATAIAYGNIAALALIGADAGLKAITYTREFNRNNYRMSLERQLQGKRTGIATGSAYYD